MITKSFTEFYTSHNCFHPRQLKVHVVYTQLVCRESPRKTAKDGTPILLKTCCLNDIEPKILDLHEACRCRTIPCNADSSVGYLSL